VPATPAAVGASLTLKFHSHRSRRTRLAYGGGKQVALALRSHRTVNGGTDFHDIAHTGPLWQRSERQSGPLADESIAYMECKSYRSGAILYSSDYL
jgi:hypothetical protein